MIANRQYSRVLTVAGSDSGGGAGIQADIKTISAMGCFATSAITAITAQNSVGVRAIHPVPIDIIEAQISAVLEDIGTDAMKTGMVNSSEVVEVIARMIDKFAIKSVVVDPVMVATSGDPLLKSEAVEAIKTLLIPRARVITPNIPEAEVLLGESIKGMDELPAAARQLSMNGGVSVLLKAGHLDGDRLTDILYNAEEDTILELTSQRVVTPNTHGTGCTLSSALAAGLAKGLSLNDAARAAKEYISSAIESGAKYKIGEGHGAVNHLFML